MYHSKFIFNLLLISLILNPCSSFLVNFTNLQQVPPNEAAKLPKEINIFTSISGEMVVGSEIVVTSKLE